MTLWHWRWFLVTLLLTLNLERNAQYPLFIIICNCIAVFKISNKCQDFNEFDSLSSFFSIINYSDDIIIRYINRTNIIQIAYNFLDNHFLAICGSSWSDVSCKTAVLKKFVKLTGKQPGWNLFLNKIVDLQERINAASSTQNEGINTFAPWGIFWLEDISAFWTISSLYMLNCFKYFSNIYFEKKCLKIRQERFLNYIQSLCDKMFQ